MSIIYGSRVVLTRTFQSIPLCRVVNFTRHYKSLSSFSHFLIISRHLLTFSIYKFHSQIFLSFLTLCHILLFPHSINSILSTLLSLFLILSRHISLNSILNTFLSFSHYLLTPFNLLYLSLISEHLSMCVPFSLDTFLFPLSIIFLQCIYL